MDGDIKIRFKSIASIIFICLIFNSGVYQKVLPKDTDEQILGLYDIEIESKNSPKLSINGGVYSQYNLTINFNESSSSVIGNLSVNYYNNDFVNFTRIPFHLFLSGMHYQVREGNIEILNVTSLNEPKSLLAFEVNDSAQLLWVDLESTLEPYQRAFFVIEFSSIIPDGGLDRANSHGSDSSESRIYKFTSFYPMPCVYDEFDGWNTDPYLDFCDPFYHDMAYYNLIIEAPNSTIIAASGELTEKTNNGNMTMYHFDPKFPVREVTFSASRYFIVESSLINGVNISSYFLPKSSYLWAGKALSSAVNALDFFNDSFGSYPYTTLNIVEEYTPYLGMEFPNQVYASEGIDDYDFTTSVKKQLLEKVIVHEVAHQWWYNLIGFDQIDWGFLDEGLACWSTDYYAKINYGNWEYYQFTNYFDRVRTYYTEEQLSSKINQSAYEIIENNLDFVFISYIKAPLIFEKISRTIGQDNFILGLKTFFDQFKFEIALLSDLQLILEDIVNDSLDWLFSPWFDNDYLPKYEVIKCYFNSDLGVLTMIIEDENELVNEYIYTQQVRLRIYDSNNFITYNEDVWISGTTTFQIQLTNTPVKARLYYNDDVIVQLQLATTDYIEIMVSISPQSIPSYHINVILIFCVLPILYLTYKFFNKRNKNFK